MRYRSVNVKPWRAKENKHLKSQQKPLPAVLSCGCERDYYPAAVPGTSVWCPCCERSATVRSAA